jgi:lipoprotein Spr
MHAIHRLSVITALCAGCLVTGCISSHVRFSAPDSRKESLPKPPPEKKKVIPAPDDDDFGALLDDFEELPARTEGKDAPIDKTVASWLGTPYRYGGMSKAGVDCSGLVGMIYRELGYDLLPRSSKEMQQTGSHVPLTQIRKGDLLFFRNGRKHVDHVGMYLDNDRFIHASSKLGVILSSINDDHYRSRFIEARRILP